MIFSSEIFEGWWSRQDSNLRPSHCERDALPTELRPQPRNRKKFYSKKRRAQQVCAQLRLAIRIAPDIFPRMSDAAAPAQTPSKAKVFFRRLITTVILWTVIVARFIFQPPMDFKRRMPSHFDFSRRGRTRGILRAGRKTRSCLLQMVRTFRRCAADGRNLFTFDRPSRNQQFARARKRF